MLTLLRLLFLRAAPDSCFSCVMGRALPLADDALAWLGAAAPTRSIVLRPKTACRRRFGPLHWAPDGSRAANSVSFRAWEELWLCRTLSSYGAQEPRIVPSQAPI